MSLIHNADAPLLLNIEQAAKKLGLGRSTVYALINNGSLPTVRIGSAVRLPLKDLEAWIESEKSSRTEQ